MKKILYLYLFLFGVVYCQNNEFDIAKYSQRLSANKNMPAVKLLNLYSTTPFLATINQNYNSCDYADSIRIKYNLTRDEISLLDKNGFVVSDRLTRTSFGTAFLDVYHNDLPVFVSCDAILHAFHYSYNKIFRDIELESIIPNLSNVLDKLKNNISFLDSKYSSNPQMKRSLLDIDIYLTIAANLLGKNIQLYYSENKLFYDSLMFFINKENAAEISLFSESQKTIDFSQFKVRGRYTDTEYPVLGKYFKSMIWLGRTEFYLDSLKRPLYLDRITDIRRQIIDVSLLNELIDKTNSLELIKSIDDPIKIFVGESDNVTIWNLREMFSFCGINSSDEFLQIEKIQLFINTLRNKSYAFQRILSQILYSDPMNPEFIKPATSFLLFGQRFIIDSYVTSQVVYSNIVFQNEKIMRMIPLTLDILFALGNDAAIQLLKPELEKYKYSSNLDALRFLIDSYGSDFWNESIYNGWLNAIRAMNPPKERSSLPFFMQSAAYWQQKMNSQLMSWTELRHDNLLYAKQSYTGGVICSYPHTFIEPIPSFYQNMKMLVDLIKNKITLIPNLSEQVKSAIAIYLSDFSQVSEMLNGISHKELQKLQFTEQEKAFLKNIVYDNTPGCTPDYGGWYTSLYYNDPGGREGLILRDQVVADIHTTPTDEYGNTVGWVKHVGTGDIKMGVFIAFKDDGGKCAFIGPLGSYYEYTTSNFLRLSDEEWRDSYLQKSLRPEFTQIYMADDKGRAYQNYPSLLTGISDYRKNEPLKYNLSQNYPNPFNPSTNIIYTIPSNLTNANVSLIVFDLNGKEVKRLIDKDLPAGNYITKWDGRNETGKVVPSGAYFYTLKVDKHTETKRMIFVK